jgi:hypothetical protein
MTMNRNKWLVATGLILGALGGYVYYQYWGCSGTCSITSSPWRSTTYGAVMGVLLLINFQSEKKDKPHV